MLTNIRMISQSYVRGVSELGYHRIGCGCLFISKAHTNFTSILIEAQSQDEGALLRHAVDDHSQCDYHVCSCGACENKDQIACQGKPKYCKFHVLR